MLKKSAVPAECCSCWIPARSLLFWCEAHHSDVTGGVLRWQWKPTKGYMVREPDVILGIPWWNMTSPSELLCWTERSNNSSTAGALHLFAVKEGTMTINIEKPWRFVWPPCFETYPSLSQWLIIGHLLFCPVDSRGVLGTFRKLKDREKGGRSQPRSPFRKVSDAKKRVKKWTRYAYSYSRDFIWMIYCTRGTKTIDLPARCDGDVQYS